MPTIQLPALPLDCGVSLRKARLSYQIDGPDSAAAPLFLVMGGISANRNASGWWAGVVGPELAIDTRHVRVLGIDWLGGVDGGEIDEDFAGEISVRDQARAVRSLLREIGIERLDAIVGSSFGGLITQALLEERPAIAGRAVIVGAAHKPDPWASGLRHVQRQILASAADSTDVALARSLAMLSYRSPEEFLERFDGPDDVTAYLDHCGRGFAERFNRQAYLRLSRAIDTFAGEPEKIVTPLTLIGFDTDLLAPPVILEEMHRRCACSQLVVLKSIYGHDAFLKEKYQLTKYLKNIPEECADVS